MGGQPHRSLVYLKTVEVSTLRALWQETYGTSAPARAKRDLLTRCLAYVMQEHAHGVIGKPTLRALREAGRGRVSDASTPPPLQYGARLVRGWRGSTYEVTVVERGFVYRGQQYRSLSEIARVITGAHWSGPRFFGVRAKTDKVENNHDASA